MRLKKIVYPTTTKFLEPLYSTADQNDVLSRVKQLRFTQSGAVVVADYSYLGLVRPVVVDYPEPDVKLNLASGSGNYPYAGLDQFDRLLQVLWQYYGSPSADREKVVCGYDLAANRLTRDNQLSGSGGQDEKYAYDGLWQASTLDRGTLSGGNITSKVFGQAWTFDQTGNWVNFKQDDNGDGTWDLNQNRTHNLANEIATIQVWGAVVHDALGNMTRIPKPSSPANRYACIWDAWNRVVEVKETDASGNPTTTVAAYAYDGFYRRTKKVIGASTRDYYYSLGWQVLEERVAGALERQFVWGIRHIDDLVLRDRGAERLYAVHDAMHVTAVTNAAGAVQERYGYEGFGKPRFMDASFGARASSSFEWEILFDGYRFDTETGLYQVRFRYLHPGLGRWMSRDPMQENAGVNLYGYVGNRPTAGLDAMGLIDCEALKRDIERQREGLRRIDRMYLYWKPGESYEDYGLTALANAAGWRSREFSGLSEAGQAAVNCVEHNWALNLGQLLGLIWWGGLGSLRYGDEQLMLAHIRMERVRARLILMRMEKVYDDECTSKK